MFQVFNIESCNIVWYPVFDFFNQMDIYTFHEVLITSEPACDGLISLSIKWDELCLKSCMIVGLEFIHYWDLKLSSTCLWYELFAAWALRCNIIFFAKFIHFFGSFSLFWSLCEHWHKSRVVECDCMFTWHLKHVRLSNYWCWNWISYFL